MAQPVGQKALGARSTPRAVVDTRDSLIATASREETQSAKAEKREAGGLRDNAINFNFVDSIAAGDHKTKPRGVYGGVEIVNVAIAVIGTAHQLNWAQRAPARVRRRRRCRGSGILDVIGAPSAVLIRTGVRAGLIFVGVA